MPVYDYLCPKCGEKRTQTVSITETEFKAICKCGETMQRIYGFSGAVFKGTGFYSTDKK